MSEWFQRAVYEAASMLMCGEQLSALAAGFAVLIGDEFYLTGAGERYLADMSEGQRCR